MNIVQKSSVILGISFLLIQPILANQQAPHQKYLKQAKQIFNKMSLDEKIGQLLLPTNRLLATGVPQPAGKSPGYLCQQAMIDPEHFPLVSSCGIDQISKYKLGAVLQDGGPYYNYPSINNWAQLNAAEVKEHKKVVNDPLLLTGNDAIHGNNHVAGAVIFPHNINLGVTHDPKLVTSIGKLTAADSLTAGFNWVYMPTVAVAQDIRWGRSYESFGQDTQLVKTLANAYITGYQQIDSNQITGALASVKHFIGDGATRYGLDEGDAVFTGTQDEFWLKNGLGYEGALDAGVLNFMVSYNAINGDRMHFGGAWDILNKFKNEGIAGSDQRLYKFSGFSVSDYNGPTRTAFFYNQQHKQSPLTTLPQMFAKSINAGVDMVMLGNGDTNDPFDLNPKPEDFYYTSVGQAFDAMKAAYTQGLISDARLEDAVTRILATKLAVNSAQHSLDDYPALQAQQREVALQAAQESLVLLKNDKGTLPLKSDRIKYIVFLGETNDLGVQNGGWTINWQGQKTDKYFQGADKISSGANTIEEALIKQLPRAKAIHVNDIKSKMDKMTATNTVVISVVAEPPYAEYMGDIANPYEVDQFYVKGAKGGENDYMPLKQSDHLALQWEANDTHNINTLRAKGIHIITIVYSGRPVILSDGGRNAPLSNSHAVIAAFLPGTLGGDALANAILGSYRFKSNKFSNTLTFPWPQNMDDVADQFSKGSLYPIGYGLAD